MHPKLKNIARSIKIGMTSVLPGPAPVRQTARRLIALKTMGLFRDELTFQRNGFTWTGATASSITESIYTHDHYQDEHLDQLTDWLKAHTDFQRPVIVNVGANIGDVALPLTRTGRRIVAIEPNPETFARLERNVRQNGLTEKITCFPVAISSSAGQAELVIATDPGNSELRESADRLGLDGVDQRRAIVKVTTARLDGLLESNGIALRDVALVWSDTQGFESQVIASAPGLWEAGTPLWVEIWPKGLACHGGVDQFVQLCERYFRRMITATELASEPQPISAIRSLVAGLKDAEFTDALLIP
ncbi:MAG TPA: FkbM family methyltransferase [Verrucomicrobiota bacterium]|nr:hypothetical protein [Verrucomicrobiales bacterium]HRI15184.1 FkbM family methyltransferase [Verrucomicrobiota bacterium]